MNNIEKIKAKFAADELVLGMAVTMTDPVTSEIAAEVGYDFTFIDMEHGPITIETANRHVMAVRRSDTAAFIRVPWGDPVLIKPVLELHPAGLIVPMVCSAEETATVVAACKYPPVGNRGFGPARGTHFGGIDVADYLAQADDQILVITQVEHIKAVENLDAILATPGLDTIMIGPNDLSGSMGLMGQRTHPKVVQVIEEIITRGRAAGVPVGLAGMAPESVAGWRAKGVSWMSVAGDGSLVSAGARAALRQARNLG